MLMHLYAYLIFIKKNAGKLPCPWVYTNFQNKIKEKKTQTHTHIKILNGITIAFQGYAQIKFRNRLVRFSLYFIHGWLLVRF